MLLAQVMIPLSAAAAVLFALWFILDTLRRDQGSERDRTFGEAVQQGLGTLARRQFGAIGAFCLVAAAAAGVVAWSYEDSAQIGFIAAAAVLAGAISSAAAAYVGVGLAGAAVSRVAAAASSSAPSAVGAALGSAVVPGLLATGLHLAGLAGAFAITTRLLDYPAARAPYLLVAFVLGASTVALVTRVSGGIFANAGSLAFELTAGSGSAESATVTAMAGNQAAAGGSIADLSESMTLQAVAAMLLGVSSQPSLARSSGYSCRSYSAPLPCSRSSGAPSQRRYSPSGAPSPVRSLPGRPRSPWSLVQRALPPLPGPCSAMPGTGSSSVVSRASPPRRR